MDKLFEGTEKGIEAAQGDKSNDSGRKDEVFPVEFSELEKLSGNELPQEIFHLSRQLLKQYQRLRSSQRKTREIQEFNDRILNSIGDGIVVATSDFRIEYSNDAFFAMFGEGRGKSICRKLIEEHFGSRGLDGRNGNAPRFGIREFEDEEHRHYLVSFAPFEHGQGELCLLIIFKDITEMKRLQLKLVQTEKLSSIGTLISGIAHELNNPLTGVMGYAELLLEADDCSQRVKNDLSKIHREAVRCQKIVQNLLVFTRSHQPVKKAVDLNGALEGVLDLRSYHFDVENIQVELDLSKETPTAMADPYQLQQVFLNIINNACHAIQDAGIPNGRIRIRTRIRRGFLHGQALSLKGLESRRRMAVVEIEDNGPGIDDSVKKKIFDPFFTTKAVGRGTGLGLSISYGIVRELEGQIHVRSQRGKGTVFTIEVPAVDGNHAAGAESEKSLGCRLLALKILVVDDEPIICEMLKTILEKDRHQVTTHVSARQAVAALEKGESFDLVFSDLKMPGMGGMELYDWLLTHRPDLTRRVIFMSGDTMGISTQNFLHGTGRYYVSKPFEFEELFDVISKTILTLPQGEKPDAN